MVEDGRLRKKVQVVLEPQIVFGKLEFLMALYSLKSKRNTFIFGKSKCARPITVLMLMRKLWLTDIG